MLRETPWDTVICPVVLAGGSSRRMGRHKAALMLPNGETLLQRALNLLQQLQGVVSVQCLPPRVSGALWGGVADIGVSRGPVSGLHAVSQQLRSEGYNCTVILAIPVDMPLLSLGPLAQLCRSGISSSEPVLCFGNLWLPLWLRLDMDVCSYLQRVVDGNGNASLRQLVRELNGSPLPLSGFGACEWQENVNRPQDFLKVLHKLDRFNRDNRE